MDQQAFQQVSENSPEAIPTQMRRIEGQEWWLWGFAVAVTMALTLGIFSFTFRWFNRETDASYWFDLKEWVRALAQPFAPHPSGHFKNRPGLHFAYGKRPRKPRNRAHYYYACP